MVFLIMILLMYEESIILMFSTFNTRQSSRSITRPNWCDSYVSKINLWWL